MSWLIRSIDGGENGQSPNYHSSQYIHGSVSVSKSQERAEGVQNNFPGPIFAPVESEVIFYFLGQRYAHI